MENADIIFRQDNDPKYISNLASDWFEQQQYKVLEWPSQSSDRNLIEHVGYQLKQ